MKQLNRLFLRIRHDNRGVSTSEYAVMLVLVALAVAGFGVGLSDSVTGVFDSLIALLAP